MAKLLLVALWLALPGTLLAQDCANIRPFVPRRAPVHRVNFEGQSALLDDAKQSEIATAALSRSISPDSVEQDMPAVADEIAERTRRSLQDEGYFSAKVDSQALRLTQEPPQYDITVAIQGPVVQFRLGDLQFENAGSFPTNQLRELFAIQQGAIFDREKIIEGLDAIRRLYKTRGYINVTLVPETGLNEETATANLIIDVDQGKQFRFRSLRVLGADLETTQRISEEFSLKPGDVYTPEATEEILLKFPGLVDRENSSNVERIKLDERNGLVDLILDFKKLTPCKSK